MKLFYNSGNVEALKVLISSTENDKKTDVAIVKPDARVVPYLHRTKLPVLEVSTDRFLFSANAAARLLYSECTADAGLVDQWLEWESGLLQPVVHYYVAAYLTKSKEEMKIGDERLRQLLTFLQDNLQSTHLIGNKLSVADVAVWASVFPILNESSPTSALRAEFKSLQSWFSTLASRPSFTQAVQTIFEGKIEEHLKIHFTSMPAPPLLESKFSHHQDKKPEQKSPTESVSSEQSATEQELAAATDAWQNGRSKVNKPRQLNKPILPIEGDRNILVTSALPYVNNVPHLGNIIGCVLSADVFARYCRLRNYNTLYICGTDEYGTATETKAVEEGLTPKEICDKYNKLHTEIYQWFNCGFDYFGRTTTKQQTKIAQDIFWGLHKNGYILKDSVEQLQCEKCVRFLADRFVEGICPLCGYEDARGDQCDKCGKLLNATDLIKPRCKVCGDTPAIKTSHHLFLDLPNLEPKLSSYLNEAFQKGIWTSNCKVITKSWIRDGLKPRCISRDLKWGTPVPLEGYTNKVFYVWYDAPIGYISITANYTENWEKWWKNPEQVQYYQFMAKDNVPFHSVIFPCTLLGTKEPWTMVNHLSATEYLNYEDGKFSKSRGVGVFGNNAKDTGIPADIWRFYLLFLRPESQDSSFCWDDFATKNNSELLNNLGNFINRALMFVSNSFAGTIPTIHPIAEDFELMALITRELKTFMDNLEKVKLRDGIRNILSISRLGNQYMQANKPWVLVKGSETEKVRAGTVVGLAANVACLLSVMLQPYMPEVSHTIQTQLNAPAECNVLITDFVCFLPEGHTIGKPSPLFQKIEQAQIDELKEKFKGQQDTKPAAAATTNPVEAERLTAEITKQGEVVRQLKSVKAEKSAIDAEVAKLLDLKRQLTAAQGGAAPSQAQGGKKKGKPGKQAAGTQQSNQCQGTPAALTPVVPTNPAEVERLTAEVTRQGDKVREVKSNKAEKSIVDAEVAKLLSLKRELAVAQGLNPDDQQAGGKKKKVPTATLR